MKNFAFGFLTAAVVLLLAVWLARHEIIKWASVGYEVIDRPAVLLTNIELRQNGKEVGKMDKGAVVFVKGRAKDSPMEYFSVSLGRENRGIDDKTVYRVLTKEESVMVEMVPLR